MLDSSTAITSRLRARLALTASLAVLLISACGKPAPHPHARTTNVLFIGDSLLGENDFPHVFSGIADSQGNPVNIVANIPAGRSSTTMRALNNTDFLQNQLPSKNWDFAVIQEHSELPIVSGPGDSVAPSVRSLSDAIRLNEPRTRLAYRVTWGFKNGDPANCGNFPVLCTFDGMQDALEAAYAEMARDNSGVIVPVGQAWRLIRRSHPEVNLYADDHHPSLQGTYLTACVVYCILFKKKSSGADPKGLDSAQATVLQEAADTVVFDPNSAWYRFERSSQGQQTSSRHMAL